MCVILDKYRFPWSLAKVKWDIECWEHPVSISSTNQRYRWYPIGKFVLPENKTDVFSILLFFRHSICCNSSWARLCVWHHSPFAELLKLFVQHRSLFKHHGPSLHLLPLHKQRKLGGHPGLKHNLMLNPSPSHPWTSWRLRHQKWGLPHQDGSQQLKSCNSSQQLQVAASNLLKKVKLHRILIPVVEEMGRTTWRKSRPTLRSQ